MNDFLSEREPEATFWQRLRTTPLGDLLRGRLSGKWDVDVILAEADVSPAVRQRIRELVKRTRLTLPEKAAIATELVAHFQDGREAGVEEAELLSAFGDVRTSAKLMRRAKLRCRSWPRQLLRRTGQALGALVVLYLGAVIYYAGGRPEVSVDYLARLNAPVLEVPEDERAWPLYREAWLEIGAERLKDLPTTVGLEPGSSDWQKAVDLIEANESALEKIRLAASKQNLGYLLQVPAMAEDGTAKSGRGDAGGTTDALASPSSETFLAAVSVPYIKKVNSMRRLLGIDALLGADQGDAKRVSDSIEALLGLAGQMMDRPLLIDTLIGLATLDQAIQVSGKVLREHPHLLSGAELHRLAHAFASRQVTPRINLSGERLTFLDIVQRVYTDDGEGDGHWVPGAFDEARRLFVLEGDDDNHSFFAPFGTVALTPATNLIMASREEMVDHYNRQMKRFEASVVKPYWEVKSTIPEELRGNPQDLLERSRYFLAAGLSHAFNESIFQTKEEAIGKRDGILVAIALEVYRRRKGDWPDSLDALVPELLPSLPRDRFTGDSLRYRLDAGEVIVYSVGPDLEDDGGVLPEHKMAPDSKKSAVERFDARNRKAGIRENKARDGDWILWHSAPTASFLKESMR